MTILFLFEFYTLYLPHRTFMQTLPTADQARGGGSILSPKLLRRWTQHCDTAQVRRLERVRSFFFVFPQRWPMAFSHSVLGRCEFRPALRHKLQVFSAPDIIYIFQVLRRSSSASDGFLLVFAQRWPMFSGRSIPWRHRLNLPLRLTFRFSLPQICCIAKVF